VRSGALITARLALEQGREVFAVPGDVGRETSMGTNLLIRDGAHPLTDVESVVEMLELVVGPAPSPLGQAVEVAGVRLDASMLIEEVVVRSELPATEVLAALAALEMRGLVRTAEGWVGPV